MKKIFSILAAVLFSATMFADKIYFKVTADWWKYDYENLTAVGAYAWKGDGDTAEKLAEWPGVVMSAVEGETDLWVAEIDLAKFEKIIFTRILPDGTYKGVKTADLVIPSDGKNLYTVTKATRDWSNDPEALAETDGEWSVYTPAAPVDPDPETPGELPVVELVGVMNDWTPAALTPAEDEKTASIKVELKAMNYEFKIKVAGNWLTLDAGPDAKYEIKRDHNAPEKHFGSLGENTVLVVDVPGEYILTWTYADSTLAVTFPALPEITLSDGYYLIGLTGWSIYALTEDLKLEKNTGLEDADEYFKKNVVLEEGQEFKVVEVKDKALGAWFGMGESADNANDNYKVSADVKGTRDIYFRPEYKADWKGHIFVNWEATAIDNTAVEAKAVKMIENGQIVIIKNGVRYNVLGAQF